MMRVESIGIIDSLLCALIPLLLLFERLLLAALSLSTEELPAPPWAWPAMISCGLLAILFTGWQILASRQRSTPTKVLALLALVALALLIGTIGFFDRLLR
ncbi:MAG: hypothetical protein HOA95_09395 [Planctomycetes bacterium]|jgi:hypothetical protein|nr:hypothetical protein [Planctomycetota bacterium]